MSNPLINRRMSAPGAAPTPLPKPAPMHRSPTKPATLPKGRLKPQPLFAIKALITTASLAVTVGGWGWLVGQALPTDQNTQAIASAQSPADAPVAMTNPLDGLRKVTLPADADLPANSAPATNPLLTAPAPSVVNPPAADVTANNGGGMSQSDQAWARPRARIRTRSSR